MIKSKRDVLIAKWSFRSLVLSIAAMLMAVTGLVPGHHLETVVERSCQFLPHCGIAAHPVGQDDR